jgi:hypothetical protein
LLDPSCRLAVVFGSRSGHNGFIFTRVNGFVSISYRFFREKGKGARLKGFGFLPDDQERGLD